MGSSGPKIQKWHILSHTYLLAENLCFFVFHLWNLGNYKWTGGYIFRGLQNIDEMEDITGSLGGRKVSSVVEWLGWKNEEAGERSTKKNCVWSSDLGTCDPEIQVNQIMRAYSRTNMKEYQYGGVDPRSWWFKPRMGAEELRNERTESKLSDSKVIWRSCMKPTSL